MRTVDSTSHGTKRKHSDVQDEEQLVVKIAGKLHHGVKEVHKASKKAKVFETQKLVKRLKNVKLNTEDDQMLNELEEQLNAIKGVDHTQIANAALKNKIMKDRLLSKNEQIHAASAVELASFVHPAPTGTPLAKIQSKLLSSKVLAAEIAIFIDTLRQLLTSSLPPDDDRDADMTPITMTVKKMRKTTPISETAGGLSTKPSSTSGVQEPLGNESDDEEPANGSDWDSGTVDGEEKQTDDNFETDPPSDATGTDSSDDELDDPRISSDVAEMGIGQNVPTPKPVKPSNLATSGLQKISNVTQSTFLPSLSVGYIRGDSDGSEWSGDEGKNTDIEPKKNRRGQRARRAIWEKKYGRNANHKKKEAEEWGKKTDKSAAKNNGYSGSRSFKSHSGTSTRHLDGRQATNSYQQQQSDRGWGQRTASIPLTSTKVTNLLSKSQSSQSVNTGERPIHPSWEAKRKLKEKQNGAIIASQGKKIVF